MMRLLLSIPAAFVGSLAGSALRSALGAAEERLDTKPGTPAAEMNINVSGSPVAALGGGLVGMLFGARTAFWAGMALGAAGMERFDMRLLKMGGVDIQSMIERARGMAAQMQGSETEPAPAAEFTVETETPSAEPA